MAALLDHGWMKPPYSAGSCHDRNQEVRSLRVPTGSGLRDGFSLGQLNQQPLHLVRRQTCQVREDSSASIHLSSRSVRISACRLDRG